MARDRYVDQELDGRYRLQRLIDSGSFGAVYEARDLKLDRTVAVKILFDPDDTSFRKEAMLAVQFEHPNVVKVFDYGSDENLDVGFIVMEFLDGKRLDQVITSMHGRVPWPIIAQFVDEIGSALQLAHDRQLIHRDLKPRNVMSVDDGTSQNRFVLLDLGLASQTDSTSTLRNQTLDGALSPEYASPEQFSQTVVDYRSDIYSFGTILFELVAGQIPFLRDQLPAMMLAITAEPAPRLADIAPDREAPTDLDDIVLHCLEKQPSARPESIRIVREKVLELIPRSSSTAAPYSIPPRSSPPHTMSFAGDDTDVSRAVSGHAGQARTGTMLPQQASDAATPSAGNIPSTGHVAPQPAWKRTKRPQQRNRAVVITLVLLLPAILFAAWKMLPQGDPHPESPHSGKVILRDELTLLSGESANMQVFVEPPFPATVGGSLTLQIKQSPDWLRISIPDVVPLAEQFEIQVAADSTVESHEGDLIFSAELGEWSEQKTVHVRVQAPEVWSLPPGFVASPGSRIVQSVVDGRTFHERVVRVTNNDLSVDFVLIDPPPDAASNRVIPPFYVMENKVWNALYQEYWSQLSEKDLATDDDRNWIQGATASGQDLGVADHPQLPTVRMTAVQAHRFAVWLAGNKGHLPSYDQWNLASGLQHRKDVEGADHNLYADGPYRHVAGNDSLDVAVNRRDQGPLPVGTAQDDITITGLRDMAGNGLELTESVLQQPGLRLGVIAGRDDNPSQLRIHLRGRSYISRQPLTWQEIGETAEYPDAIGYTEVDPVVGFRVVLETAD
jgi:serine/threonine protein kinase